MKSWNQSNSECMGLKRSDNDLPGTGSRWMDWEGWGYSVPTPHVCAQLPSSMDQQLFRMAGSDSVPCSSVPVTQGIPHACVQLYERVLTSLRSERSPADLLEKRSERAQTAGSELVSTKRQAAGGTEGRQSSVVRTMNQYQTMEFVILKKGRKESNRIMITKFKKDFSEVREAAVRVPGRICKGRKNCGSTGCTEPGCFNGTATTSWCKGKTSVPEAASRLSEDAEK